MTITAEQRAMRAQGIGGSDAPIIAGVSPWKTPLALWMEKRGTTTEISEANLPMKIGTALESLILNEWAAQTGREVTLQDSTLFALGNRTLFAHIDGQVKGCNEGIEAKWVGRPNAEWGDPDTDAVPAHVFIQCAHYLMVTGWNRWHVAACMGGQDVRVYVIERNEAIIEHLRAMELEFWRKVQDGTPPDMQNAADARLRWPRDDGSQITASPDVLEILAQLQHVRNEARDYAVMQDKLEGEVQKYMGEASTLVNAAGAVYATWKLSKPSERLDTKALRAACPDVAQQFTITAPGSRRFLLKTAKDN